VFVTFVLIFKFILIYLLYIMFILKIKGIFGKKNSTQKVVFLIYNIDALIIIISYRRLNFVVEGHGCCSKI